MRAITLVLALSACGLLHAQTQQTGVTLEYNGNRPKTPLPNVQIVAMGSTAMSDAQGNFVLQLSTMKKGERIWVRRIVKQDYMIFNDQAVEQWVTSDAPFQLVLCKSADFKRWVDQYYNLGLSSYKKKLEETRTQLKQLREAGQIMDEEYRRQLQEAQNLFEQELQQLDGIANKFARIDETQIDSIQQRALDLIRAGEFDEAISVLERQEYSRRLSEAVETRNNSERLRQEGEQMVQEAHEDSLRVMEQLGIRHDILDEKQKRGAQ